VNAAPVKTASYLVEVATGDGWTLCLTKTLRDARFGTRPEADRFLAERLVTATRPARDYRVRRVVLRG
jgi:hypothetical protein